MCGDEPVRLGGGAAVVEAGVEAGAGLESDGFDGVFVADVPGVPETAGTAPI